MCGYHATFLTGDSMFKQLALIAALTSAGASASASGLPDYPFVHTTGSATTYQVPDVGEIDFELIVTDPNPEAALAQMDERVAAIRAIVQANAIAEGDFQVRNVRREQRKDNTGIVDIKSTVRINVRTLANWAIVVRPLLSMPNVQGLITAFDVTDRDKIMKELMGDAIKDARIKAESMAAGLGRKLGPASAVTSGQLKNLTTAMGLAATTPSYGGNTTRREQQDGKDFLMIEAQKYAQPVDIIFRLK
jgi:uncharacterized protein YggE